MAHTHIEDLQDLHTVLEQIRQWPGIIERSPGIFYLKRLPFLHFHTKENRRWADVRAGKNWGELFVIPFGADGAQIVVFGEYVTKCYQLTQDALKKNQIG